MHSLECVVYGVRFEVWSLYVMYNVLRTIDMTMMIMLMIMMMMTTATYLGVSMLTNI